jgi:hypothetical protein
MSGIMAMMLGQGAAVALAPFPYTKPTFSFYNLTESAPGGTSPSGAAVRRFTETSANDYHYWSVGLHGSASNPVTIACEYKIDSGLTHSVHQIRLETNGGSATFLTTDGTLDWAPGVTATTTDLGGGWFRLVMTLTQGSDYISVMVVLAISGNGVFAGSTSRYYDLGAIGYTWDGAEIL